MHRKGKKMALYEKMLEAWNNRDVEAYWACLHDEWEMTWHSTGKVTNKTSMSAEQMKTIMENADIKDRRCIYENDEILGNFIGILIFFEFCQKMDLNRPKYAEFYGD